MKENEFLDGISNIETDVVEQFVSMDNRLKRKTNKRSIWVRVGALAACFALIASVILSVISNVVPTDDPIPTWDNAHYSASDIAKVFSATKLNGTTNAYTEIYIPDEKYLYIDEISDEEYLPIYKYTPQVKKTSKAEFEKFVSEILPKLTKYLGINVNGDYNFEDELDIYEKTGKYTLYINQNTSNTRVQLSTSSSGSDREIKLDRETIQIDQRLTDDEILESIESIKNKLFDIFGVSFKDTKIVRDFGGYHEYGADFIYLYFYDEDAHPLNKYLETPVSDSITISFDNFENYAGDIVSDGILTTATVYYYKNRTEISKVFAHTENDALISLEDAEKLLHKGYVFGGHSCPLCMAAQDKISFEGYDFVDMEYVYDMYSDKPTNVIPFYAFYKKIGTSQNGNAVYAKTYVPAIQVSGYEKYFENQAANHR